MQRTEVGRCSTHTCTVRSSFQGLESRSSHLFFIIITCLVLWAVLVAAVLRCCFEAALSPPRGTKELPGVAA